MRRFVCLLAGVLLVVPSLGWDAPREYDGATKADELKGTWELVDHTMNGQKLLYEEVITFRGGTFTSCFGKNTPMKAPYRIDPTRTPAHYDYTLDGHHFRGIYQIHGDKLKVALRTDPNDTQRPHGFGEQNLFISTYNRVKK
jgi:uncharacterized protein (TIGR03067 family)